MNARFNRVFAKGALPENEVKETEYPRGCWAAVVTLPRRVFLEIWKNVLNLGVAPTVGDLLSFVYLLLEMGTDIELPPEKMVLLPHQGQLSVPLKSPEVEVLVVPVADMDNVAIRLISYWEEYTGLTQVPEGAEFCRVRLNYSELSPAAVARRWREICNE